MRHHHSRERRALTTRRPVGQVGVNCLAFRVKCWSGYQVCIVSQPGPGQPRSGTGFHSAEQMNTASSVLSQVWSRAPSVAACDGMLSHSSALARPFIAAGGTATCGGYVER